MLPVVSHALESIVLPISITLSKLAFCTLLQVRSMLRGEAQIPARSIQQEQVIANYQQTVSDLQELCFTSNYVRFRASGADD